MRREMARVHLLALPVLISRRYFFLRGGCLFGHPAGLTDQERQAAIAGVAFIEIFFDFYCTERPDGTPCGGLLS